jgi:hypothetical protein
LIVGVAVLGPVDGEFRPLDGTQDRHAHDQREKRGCRHQYSDADRPRVNPGTEGGGPEQKVRQGRRQDDHHEGNPREGDARAEAHPGCAPDTGDHGHDPARERDRGHDGSSGALLTTDEEPDAVFRVGGDDARITGLRIRGAFPDSYVTHEDGISYSNDGNTGIEIASSGAEIDNCEICGFVLAGIYVESGDGSTHVHHSFVHQNNTQGLGYGVAVGYDESAAPLVEYNYFDANRHSVAATGENHGYTARYNHFGPTSVMHPIDIHDPGSQETLIENNVVESLVRTWDDNCCHAIDGFDGTEGVVHIEGNWFWNDSCTYDVPTDDPDIEVVDNDYGEGATTFADVIPNHPGESHRPWA